MDDTRNQKLPDQPNEYDLEEVFSKGILDSVNSIKISIYWLSL